ncbi:Speckle-type POZ protein B [Araneus ventricosus]|uniref:Speckle-type POZ protein B n=1 Tax=Araneus ventricosus TaxID=182803 RepID=A0A4Y2EJQ2_ARAVE|nr:Speckle-type POZ protein B [Araneus ventricosus]
MLEQNGFTITWKTENVNFCRAHKDYLHSPKFVASTLQNTEWILKLDIFRKDMDIDSLKVTLRRLDSVPDIFTVNIGMAIVIPGHSDQDLGKKELASLKKNQEMSFTTNNLDSKISELFLDNMLTICCHISMPSVKSVISEKCVAQTRVGVERICCPWRIENFSTNYPVVVSLYSSMSNSAHNLESKGITWLTNGFLSIKICRKQAVNDGMLQVIGKISVLDVRGRTKFSTEDKFCFCPNADIWYFQISANKSALFRECQLQLTNDKMVMLCDFTFFTEVTSEIIGYVWLPPVFQSVVENKKTKENLSPKAENCYDFAKYQMNFAPKREAPCQENSADRPGRLKDDFKKLYKQRIHCDIVLCAGNKSIPCHKAILCSRSPVFKAMFDNQMKEALRREVEIPDLDGDNLHRFLMYVYSEELEDMDWIIAKKLLYAANKYEIKSLMRECSYFLKTHLSKSNVCEALEFSDMHQDHSLKTSCQEFVFKHATEVFASKDWKDFTVKKPLLSAETFQKYFESKK